VTVWVDVLPRGVGGNVMRGVETTPTACVTRPVPVKLTVDGVETPWIEMDIDPV
jgi:hypothetical protein